MSEVFVAFFAFLVAIYPLLSVATTEFVNFFNKKLRGSSLPVYVRYALTFAIAGALRFLPDVSTDIDPDAVAGALTAFVTAVLAMIKVRDWGKIKITGRPIK